MSGCLLIRVSGRSEMGLSWTTYDDERSTDDLHWEVKGKGKGKGEKGWASAWRWRSGYTGRRTGDRFSARRRRR